MRRDSSGQKREVITEQNHFTPFEQELSIDDLAQRIEGVGTFLGSAASRLALRLLLSTLLQPLGISLELRNGLLHRADDVQQAGAACLWVFLGGLFLLLQLLVTLHLAQVVAIPLPHHAVVHLQQLHRRHIHSLHLPSPSASTVTGISSSTSTSSSLVATALREAFLQLHHCSDGGVREWAAGVCARGCWEVKRVSEKHSMSPPHRLQSPQQCPRPTVHISVKTRHSADSIGACHLHQSLRTVLRQ